MLPEQELIASIDDLEIAQFSEKGVHISMLREDETDKEFGGNKWRKLKYNLLKAQQSGHDTILTLGGVWSNHIHATAAAARRFGFKSIGIIRGEDLPGSTATLEFARSCGMELHFVSRSEYREKNEDYFKAWLHDVHGRFHLIPEGGSNYLGVNGCMEILGKHTRHFDVIAVACGTGATLAGMTLSLGPHQRILGFPAVGEGEHLNEAILKQISWTLGDEEIAEEYRHRFRLHPEYSLGGFARTTPEFISFLREFYAISGIPLDPLYTGKMMWGLQDLLNKGRFVPGTRILAVHTGGLQGIAGIENRIGEKLYSS